MEDKKQASKRKFEILRQQAEDLISHQAQEGRQAEPVDMRGLVHELEVHQIELEMQNEELVQAQVELEKSRDRYIDLYDFAPVGYLTLNDKGMILEANLTAAGLLGVEHKKLIRQRLTHFVFREDQDAFYLFSKKLFETQIQQAGEVRLVPEEQGGEPLFVLLEGITTAGEGGEPVCRLSFSDISKQKVAEQALLENQANLEALLEFTNDIVWSVDRQYRLIAGNDGLRKNYIAVLGRVIRPGESTLVEKMPEVYREWSGYYDRALAGETFKIVSPTRAQPEVRYLEYTFRPVRIAGKGIGGVIVSGRDITENKQTQDALEQSEVRFAKIFFDAPVPLEISRISDGRLLEVNESFAQLFGYARDELIGHTSVEMGMFSPAEEREKIRHKLKADGCLRDEEMSTYNRSGEMVQVLISAVPLIMNGEECVLGTLLDITERKKAEEMRENLIGQLNTAQEQQRMLSARLMAAQETERRVIARELHDEVGQALTALKINLQTAQRKLNNGMDLAESIAMVENTLQQVRTISLNLPPTVLEDLGLVPALRWLLDRQGREAGFSTSFITDIGEVRLDPQIEIACFRVAQEALTNVMRHAHAQHVNMTLEKINKELHLTVHDDGKGYDVEAAYQRAWHGNSLGLVGMQERVVLAGGRMEIESGPGKGTRIHASFPLARSQPDDGEGGKLP